MTDLREPFHALAYETTFDPSPELSSTIERGLHEHNLAVLGPEVIYNYTRFAAAARGSDGQAAGGLLGQFIWNFLVVDVLWVSPEARGQDIGTHLLQMAESAARQRAVDFIILETTSFQARDFYLKNGFEVYGQLEGRPRGHTWYHMKKDLRS